MRNDEEHISDETVDGQIIQGSWWLGVIMARRRGGEVGWLEVLGQSIWNNLDPFHYNGPRHSMMMLWWSNQRRFYNFTQPPQFDGGGDDDCRRCSHGRRTFLDLVWYLGSDHFGPRRPVLWSYSCIMVKFTRDGHNGCIQRNSRAKMVIWGNVGSAVGVAGNEKYDGKLKKCWCWWELPCRCWAWPPR